MTRSEILMQIREEVFYKTFKLSEVSAMLKTELKKKYDIIELTVFEAKTLKLMTIIMGYNLVREVSEGEFEYSFMEFEVNRTDKNIDLMTSNYEIGYIEITNQKGGKK